MRNQQRIHKQEVMRFLSSFRGWGLHDLAYDLILFLITKPQYQLIKKTIIGDYLFQSHPLRWELCVIPMKAKFQWLQI